MPGNGANPKMALSDKAEAIDKAKPGPRCGIYQIRQTVSPSDNAWLDENLSPDSGRTSTWISEVLKADGHDISEFTVQRHRRRKCSCVPVG